MSIGRNFPVLILYISKKQFTEQFNLHHRYASNVIIYTDFKGQVLNTTLFGLALIVSF